MLKITVVETCIYLLKKDEEEEFLTLLKDIVKQIRNTWKVWSYKTVKIHIVPGYEQLIRLGNESIPSLWRI